MGLFEFDELEATESRHANETLAMEIHLALFQPSARPPKTALNGFFDFSELEERELDLTEWRCFTGDDVADRTAELSDPTPCPTRDRRRAQPNSNATIGKCTRSRAHVRRKPARPTPKPFHEAHSSVEYQAKIQKKQLPFITTGICEKDRREFSAANDNFMVAQYRGQQHGEWCAVDIDINARVATSTSEDVEQVKEENRKRGELQRRQVAIRNQQRGRAKEPKQSYRAGGSFECELQWGRGFFGVTDGPSGGHISYGHFGRQCPTILRPEDRWASLLHGLLRRTSCHWHRAARGGRSVVRPTSCRPVSSAELRRWQHLSSGLPAVPSSSALADRLPLELTLAYQVCVAELAEVRSVAYLRERQWREKWLRWRERVLVASVFRSWSRPLREARQEREARERVHEFAAGAADRLASPDILSDVEAAEAASLGLDVPTYRLLRELQHREITPEDYELLGRLDEPVAAPTLTPEQLRRFPSEVYQKVPRQSAAVHPHCAEGGSTCFGLDYWRLPLLMQEGEGEEADAMVSEPHGLGAQTGPYFWRLPLASDDCVSASLGSTEDDSSRDDGDSRSSCEEVELCAICIVSLEDGDAVRTLQPCRHRFHKSCIDQWLLEKSTRCPVDNLELFV